MKTPIFFITAFVAFIALPVDFVTMASFLVGAGLVAIMASDYRMDRRQLRAVPIHAAVARHRLRLAA